MTNRKEMEFIGGKMERATKVSGIMGFSTERVSSTCPTAHSLMGCGKTAYLQVLEFASTLTEAVTTETGRKANPMVLVRKRSQTAPHLMANG